MRGFILGESCARGQHRSEKQCECERNGFDHRSTLRLPFSLQGFVLSVRTSRKPLRRKKPGHRGCAHEAFGEAMTVLALDGSLRMGGLARLECGSPSHGITVLPAGRP
jgi:hypothetical protein